MLLMLLRMLPPRRRKGRLRRTPGHRNGCRWPGNAARRRLLLLLLLRPRFLRCGRPEIEAPRDGRRFRPAVERGRRADRVHHPHGGYIVEDGLVAGVVGNDHHLGDVGGHPRGLFLVGSLLLLLLLPPRGGFRGGAGGRRDGGLFLLVVVAPVFLPGGRGRHRWRRRRVGCRPVGRAGCRVGSSALLLLMLLLLFLFLLPSLGSGRFGLPPGCLRLLRDVGGPLHQKVPAPPGPSAPLEVLVGFHDGRVDVLFLAPDDVLDVESLDVGGLVIVGPVGVDPDDDGAPAGLVDAASEENRTAQNTKTN